MLNLRRDQAPISDAAWAEIDAEAKRVLELTLAARRLVDFRGPLGWETDAVSTGRVRPLSHEMPQSVQMKLRQPQPLAELRGNFSLSRAELEDVDRGASDVELQPLIDAAIEFARAEDHAVFNGSDVACILGMGPASPHAALTISEDYDQYPSTVAEATNVLRRAGVEGPFAIALGPRCYAGLMQASTGGYPVLDRVRNILAGPVVWAPTIDGALVVSMRGGDYELTAGQDVSIGYCGHDEEQVHFFIAESFCFRVLSPEATVALRYAS